MKIPILFHDSDTNPLADAVRDAIAIGDEDGAYLLTWRLAHYARVFQWGEKVYGRARVVH